MILGLLVFHGLLVLGNRNAIQFRSDYGNAIRACHDIAEYYWKLVILSVL